MEFGQEEYPIIQKLRVLFPGKKFYILLLNILGLFFISIFEMVGVIAVLPIVNLATDAPVEGYLKTVSDYLGNPDRTTLILVFAFILVLAFVLKAIFSLFMKLWNLKFTSTQQAATGIRLLEDFVDTPYAIARRRSVSDVLDIVNNISAQAYAVFVNGIIAFIGDMLSIVVLMVMLVFVMPVPALAAFMYFGITAFLLQYMLRNKTTEQGNIVLRTMRESLDSALDVITGFREIRMYNVKKRYIDKYHVKRLEWVEASATSAYLHDIPKYILEVIFIVGIAGLALLISVTNSSDAASMLVLLVAVCVRILPNYSRAIGSLGLIRAGKRASNITVQMILDYNKIHGELTLPELDPVERCIDPVNKEIKPISIRVDNVSFKYPDGDKNVLENIDLDIPMGTSVAFVGGSGSGKTTLVDLILGLFETNQGQILQNGVSIQEDIKAWHQHIGYVPQDVFVADSTVLEAVAFGLREDEIDVERVKKCLDMAELTDVINSLEDGLYTKVGERGSRLSGGQRQRLGIARALYRNPSVLVMDEATSALDNETEHKITKTIARISQDITVIIVAHRLSTVRDVDQLVYLSQGHIVNRGTFKEVQRDNAEFARLVQLGQLPE